MFSRITSFVIVIALVVAGFWGYREHREKQALLLKAENQYQRAFHTLSDHMNLLQDELGKSLAVNSKLQSTSSLTEVWRLSAQARSDVGELPLSLMPFNNTMNFLNDVGNFSYQVAVHNEDKKPLNDQEWNTLQEMYNRSKRMEKQLSALQTAVIQKNLRWMDAELALAQTDKKTDNVIVDGFKSMEKQVKSEKPLTFSPTITGIGTRNKTNEKTLTGNPVDEKGAAQAVASFLGLPDTSGVVAKKNGKGTPYSSYSVTAKLPQDGQAYFTVTQKGGHITNFMNNREVGDPKLDLDQAGNKALAYLKSKGIHGDAIIRTDQYDSVGVFEIVPMQNDVRIYPERTTVKVALDTGDVVGLVSQDYAFNFKASRQIPAAKVTEADARKYVSPKVQIHEVHRSIVKDELQREQLCYEFIGTMDNDTYKVYISAIDGKEIGVEKLKM
ncbi:germination protein YpeB [Tumebacillus sp. ITR2]|uniref:Germination protein YpeB n=1 Tax=Tumebacillus amylolyticus TaxID=2801339 RepID=A0ABS1JBY7_9BACL|nr:germination protein YpeB [Tumebacillus amylolyticus]MBL0387789.1 germination protein YpeB [Tumebacillus amylolyticus]